MKILDLAHNLIRDENALRLVDFDLFLRHHSLYIVDQKPYNFVDWEGGGWVTRVSENCKFYILTCAHLHFYKKVKS